MFKLTLLDICIELQVNDKDKIKCEEFFNEFSKQINFFYETINLSILIIFIFLIFFFYLIVKKINFFD